MYEPLIFVNFIGNASVPLMRKACIEHVGGYSTRLRALGAQGCEDWDLALRIAERYEVGVAPAYLCAYRRVEGSMSTDCTSMGLSYMLITTAIQQGHSDIPAALFRWSQSHFFTYLGRLSYREGNYGHARRWFYHAFRTDPWLVLSPAHRKVAAKSMVRWIGGPLLDAALWLKAAWSRYGPKRPPPPRTLEDLTRNRGALPRSWTWKSWRPYDWISYYRWRKVRSRWRRRQAGPEVYAPRRPAPREVGVGV